MVYAVVVSRGVVVGVMSAFEGKADTFQGMSECPLLAKSGHCEQSKPAKPLVKNQPSRHRTLEMINMTVRDDNRGTKWMDPMLEWVER